jgi:hypothetical protein
MQIHVTHGKTANLANSSTTMQCTVSCGSFLLSSFLLNLRIFYDKFFKLWQFILKNFFFRNFVFTFTAIK